MTENGEAWHVWGYSREIDDNNEWGTLEEVVRRINRLPEQAGE
jgi:hypothetical protein